MKISPTFVTDAMQSSFTLGSRRVRIGGVRYHRCFYCDRWYVARGDEKLALHCPEHVQQVAEALSEGFQFLTRNGRRAPVLA